MKSRAGHSGASKECARRGACSPRPNKISPSDSTRHRVKAAPVPRPCSLTSGRLGRATESRIRGELERKDPSGSGVVSERALGKVLGKFGADLAGADLGRLMHRFDVHEVEARLVSATCAGVIFPSLDDFEAQNERRLREH